MLRPRLYVNVAMIILCLALALNALAGFPGSDLILPSVGRGQGVADSEWYTTVWLHNPNAMPVNAMLRFYERDQSGGEPAATASILLAAEETARLDNVVESYFGLTGLGALRVTADVKIVAVGRIFSVPPGGEERDSSGQLFAAVPSDFAIGVGQSTNLLGISQTVPLTESEYRYNFGMVEVAGDSAMVEVTVFDGQSVALASQQYSVGPHQPRQYNIARVLPDIDSVNLRLHFEVISGDGRIVAFGSGLANRSNDPSTFDMQYSDDLLAGSQTGSISGVTAGQGLTGGGTSGMVSLHLGAGEGLEVDADTVSVAGGGVVRSMIAAGAVSASKIGTDNASAGQVLRFNGTALNWVDDALVLPYGSGAPIEGPAFQASNSATTGAAIGVRGRSESESGRGVSGIAAAAIGETVGVYGRSDSFDGIGVVGEATSTGVLGQADNAVGTGVEGLGGVQGVKGANSTSGYSGHLGTVDYGVVSIGDAHVDGNLSWQDKIGYAMVPAAAFIGFSRQACNMGTSVGPCGIDAGDRARWLVAPVQLPHGATVTRLTFFWVDAISSDNGSVQLVRYDPSDVPPWMEWDVMAEVETYGSGLGNSGTSATNSIQYPQVNNSTYAYHLFATVPSESDIVGVSVHGVRIRYEFNTTY